MRKSLKRAAAGAATVAGIMSAATALAPAANAADFYGCPDGYACLYKGAGLQSGVMTKYYNYGSYNLTNVTGAHEFVNQQTGGAKAYLCTGYGGTGSCQLIPALHYGNYNFTPINSIKLTA
jgi:hypothetical protein